jgi:hypothetical protein
MMEDTKMAETTTKEKLVAYEAFKDNDKYKDDITVIVNGKIWRIKRGEKVMIPEAVYEVLMNSHEQAKAAANYSEKQEDAYKRSSKMFE